MTVIDVIARKAISVGRARFRNTWVHDLRITNHVYRRIFQAVDRPPIIDFRNVRLAIDQSDATITPTLITGQYERIELDILESILLPGMTFVDVGANNGTYTCVAASLVGAAGAVIAFEPVAANLGLLRSSLSLNSPATANVTVVEAAAGAESGGLRIYLDGDNSGTHSVGGHGADFVDVDMVTLDSVIGSRCADVIKIDVEGFEPAVLSGANSVLRSCRPVLLCEFDRGMVERTGQSAEAFARRLAEHGAVYLIDERRSALVLVDSDCVASMRNANVLVVPAARRDILGLPVFAPMLVEAVPG